MKSFTKLDDNENLCRMESQCNLLHNGTAMHSLANRNDNTIVRWEESDWSHLARELQWHPLQHGMTMVAWAKWNRNACLLPLLHNSYFYNACGLECFKQIICITFFCGISSKMNMFIAFLFECYKINICVAFLAA